MSDMEKRVEAGVLATPSEGTGKVDINDEHEVFQATNTGVNFRTVSWPRASGIFLKVLFATGVLSIPSAMSSLGAVGGSLSVLGWGLFNTYNAIVQGNFRNNHLGCHTIVDMAGVVGGRWLMELTGALYMLAFVLSTGSGIVGVSVGLNALSHHAACTVWWSLIATVAVMVVASIRKFEKLGFMTYAGFVSVFVAVLIVVIGVTTRDRPAAAPQTGPYELGYYKIVHPTYVAGMSASATIFVSSAGSSGFLPVIAEMKNPKDYNKAVLVAMAIVNSSYIAFSLVVYRWCGTWVASPSLASAGGTIKIVAYAIGLLGLIVSACLYLHLSAKYVFVRLLRGTPHLQSNSFTHWSVWFGSIFGLGSIAFILAEAIPGFNYILALTGTFCFAPLAMILPGWFWLYDHWGYKSGTSRQKAIWCFHWLIVLIGIYFTTGGSYATVKNIIDAYHNDKSLKAFSCGDNSNSS